MTFLVLLFIFARPAFGQQSEGEMSPAAFIEYVAKLCRNPVEHRAELQQILDEPDFLTGFTTLKNPFFMIAKAIRKTKTAWSAETQAAFKKQISKFPLPEKLLFTAIDLDFPRQAVNQLERDFHEERRGFTTRLDSALEIIESKRKLDLSGKSQDPFDQLLRSLLISRLEKMENGQRSKIGSIAYRLLMQQDPEVAANYATAYLKYDLRYDLKELPPGLGDGTLLNFVTQNARSEALDLLALTLDRLDLSHPKYSKLLPLFIRLAPHHPALSDHVKWEILLQEGIQERHGYALEKFFQKGSEKGVDLDLRQRLLLRVLSQVEFPEKIVLTLVQWQLDELATYIHPTDGEVDLVNELNKARIPTYVHELIAAAEVRFAHRTEYQGLLAPYVEKVFKACNLSLQNQN